MIKIGRGDKGREYECNRKGRKDGSGERERESIMMNGKGRKWRCVGDDRGQRTGYGGDRERKKRASVGDRERKEDRV